MRSAPSGVVGTPSAATFVPSMTSTPAPANVQISSQVPFALGASDGATCSPTFAVMVRTAPVTPAVDTVRALMSGPLSVRSQATR